MLTGSPNTQLTSQRVLLIDPGANASIVSAGYLAQHGEYMGAKRASLPAELMFNTAGGVVRCKEVVSYDVSVRTTSGHDIVIGMVSAVSPTEDLMPPLLSTNYLKGLQGRLDFCTGRIEVRHPHSNETCELDTFIDPEANMYAIKYESVQRDMKKPWLTISARKVELE